jgi:hypothetical protein
MARFTIRIDLRPAVFIHGNPHCRQGTDVLLLADCGDQRIDL